MDIGKLEVSVSVDVDKTVERLYEIGSLVDELSSLSIHQIEAEKIQTEIFNHLNAVICVKEKQNKTDRDV